MIYEVIKAAAGAPAVLTGKVYPAGVLIDESKLPCAVYYLGPRTAERDLGGRVHHYTETVDIHLLGEDYDQLHLLYTEVEEAFNGVANGPSGSGEYIFGVTVTCPEQDAADLELALMRRVLRVSIDWCPMD